jgi:hypothetical protein
VKLVQAPIHTGTALTAGQLMNGGDPKVHPQPAVAECGRLDGLIRSALAFQAIVGLFQFHECATPLRFLSAAFDLSLRRSL